MKMNPARAFAAAAAAALVVVLSGCAAPASKESMAVPTVAITKKFPSTVSVDTRGGAETGAMDSSNISNADLKSAIEGSITQTSLFKGVIQGSGGDYNLTVAIVQLSKPVFGASFTVDMETTWVLAKASDKSLVMRKSIKSSHTATFGDSMVGVTRLRLAVEGAARNNITQGLQAISELSL